MGKWVDDIVTALTNLDGVASLHDIYQEVRQVRPSPHPESLSAIVRGTIEDHSSDSARYKAKDLFFSVKTRCATKTKQLQVAQTATG